MAAITSAVVVAGSTAYAANKQKQAASEAARAQRQSAYAGMDAQKAALLSFEDRTDPFRKVGLAAAGTLLSDLGIQVPQELAGYAPSASERKRDSSLAGFLRREGFEDIQESAAAQGRLRSGGTLRDLTQYSENVGQQYQNQKFNQLFNLLGIGSNAATGQGTAALQTGQGISNLYQNIGQADANKAYQIGNIQSNAASQYAGAVGLGLTGYQQQQQQQQQQVAPIRTAQPSYTQQSPGL